MDSSKPTRCISVVSVPGGRGYRAPAVYEAQPRQSDGALIWRRVGMPLGRFWFHGRAMFIGHRSAAKAERVALELAASRSLPFLPTVRHNARVSA